MAIYFISDLHLNETDLNSTDLFLNFLHKYGQTAEAIYILGDFFGAWIGDNYNTPFIQTIKDVLAALYVKDIPVFFMRGNRDFLIGKNFFKSTNCIAIPDPYLISLRDTKVLLTHGDLLTPVDIGFRCFSAFVKNPVTKFLFLHLPKELRLSIARYLRSNSGNVYKRKIQKDPNIFAVAQDIVASYVTKYGVSSMIHGHIHLPGVHEFTIGNGVYKRYVLGDWNKSAKILVYENGKFELLEIWSNINAK